MKAIIGKKIGMSRVFDDKGNVIPVTLIFAQDNIVSQIKNMDRDGYDAAQIALKEDKKINKPLSGHLKGAKIKTKTLKEFNLTDVKVGDAITLDQFEKGDKITVQAISKGKGFAGTVKRHNFHTGPKTHGSDNYRRPGSIGSMYPQRVIKGRRMAGHMGHEQVTVKNLQIIEKIIDKKILMIKGAVPGANKSTVYLWKE